MDRNLAGRHLIDLGQKSLSARRAWIEILSSSMDLLMLFMSLSARRAWIEIDIIQNSFHLALSSLSARRAWIEIHVRCFSPAGCWRRSPQGERG